MGSTFAGVRVVRTVERLAYDSRCPICGEVRHLFEMRVWGLRITTDACSDRAIAAFKAFTDHEVPRCKKEYLDMLPPAHRTDAVLGQQAPCDVAPDDLYQPPCSTCDYPPKSICISAWGSSISANAKNDFSVAAVLALIGNDAALLARLPSDFGA